MREFDCIKDMVYKELDEISGLGKLDMNAVKVVGELVDILKDIGTVEMFEENVYVDDNGWYHNGGEGGYSQGYMPRRGYEGNSYRGMGRGNSYRGNMNGNRGYRGGYSYDGDKTHLINKLHGLMMEASDQKDKESIQHLIDQMENN